MSLYKTHCSNQAELHNLRSCEGPVQGQSCFFIAFAEINHTMKHHYSGLLSFATFFATPVMKKAGHPVFTFMCQLDTIRSKSLCAGFGGIVYPSHDLFMRDCLI